MKNKLNQIVDFFGPQPQTIVAIEELSELQKELTKQLRKKGSAINLTEEIADVEIMLEQLKIIYNINPNDLNEVKQFKINRTLDFIAGGLSVHEKK